MKFLALVIILLATSTAAAFQSYDNGFPIKAALTENRQVFPRPRNTRLLRRRYRRAAPETPAPSVNKLRLPAKKSIGTILDAPQN